MNRFHPATDKDNAMTHVVSYHGVVPLERGLCYALYLVGKHWPVFAANPDWVISASRDMDDIAAHNREFDTNLHGQQWQIDAHARDPEHYAPANPVRQTSHCLFSDGNHAYLTSKGKQVPVGGKLEWYQRGIDFDSNAHAADFCRRARTVGLAFVLPYPAGSELHHVVCVKSPIDVLVARNVIHEYRKSGLVAQMDEQAEARRAPHTFDTSHRPGGML